MSTSYSFADQIVLAEVVDIVTPQEAPTVALIGGANQGRCKSREHKWLTDSLVSDRSTTTMAVVEGTTEITVASSDPFSANDLVKLDGYNEVMKVTASAGGTVTVERGYGSSDAETTEVASGTALIIVARPQLESSSAGSDISEDRVDSSNYTQILRRDVIVSGTQQAVATEGVANELAWQTDLRLRECLRELNASVLWGRKAVGTATVRRSMGGIDEYVNVTDGNTLDAAGAEIDRDLLGDIFEAIFRDGGKPNLILAGVKQARGISKLNSDYMRAMRSEKQAGSVIESFMVDIPGVGAVKVGVDAAVGDRDVFILDTSRIFVRPLSHNGVNRAFFREPVKDGDDSFKTKVIGEYTLEVRAGSLAHGKLYGLGDPTA